ncbi:hypothetical protein ACFQVC_10085 [Streptomyces monticola]|uniref:Uncharacterized protein n=1 Tax=Streptomyces monticola TaxID=2666263 RepID=A0ABW2JGM0_9ACTN
MDAYLAGKDAPEGTPAHCLYIWIESLHDRMDLMVAQFTGGDWEHDYSLDSLRQLEEDLAELYATGDDTDAAALFMECLAGYLGEVLLAEGGGRWVWDESAGVAGLPAVEPDPVLGLESIVPLLLVGQAVYEKTENIFATVALRLRKAVTERRSEHRGWKPERVPTPWVRFDDLEESGVRWKLWPNERFHDYCTWWADRAGGGRERWDFGPDSLDALEELLRERLQTVQAYDKVATRRFWTVAAWYVGEYVVRRKDAYWQYRAPNPAAPPGTWYAEDSYWTGSVFVAQRLRYNGHAEHPAEMLRAVLEGESLRAVVDRFPDPVGRSGRRRRRRSGEPWPEVLWPLAAPAHLPPPLTPQQRDELAEELRELEADPALKDPELHDNPRLHAWLADRREAFADWAERADPAAGSAAAWDFSPESLDRLEALVRARFATGEEMEAAQDDWFLAGAAWYLGEVQVIHCGARWQLNPEPYDETRRDEPEVVEPGRDEDSEDGEEGGEYGDGEYGDDFDHDDYEYDEDEYDDDADGYGHVCVPAEHLRDLITRNDPGERLRDVLDGYRRGPVSDSG